MARQQENTGFVRQNCGKYIMALTNGSYRNHCPYCLYSKHVDHKPGDRKNTCHGLMAPVGLRYKSKKGWQILHKCEVCGQHSANKVAADTDQPDNYKAVAALA